MEKLILLLHLIFFWKKKGNASEIGIFSRNYTYYSLKHQLKLLSMKCHTCHEMPAECSSDNYNCTSHTNAKRRNPKFNKLLEPLRGSLEIPAYAPLRSICNACYQRAKRLTSDPHYASVSIPAEPINPEPLSDIFERVKESVPAVRSQFLRLCLTLGYTDSQINAHVRDSSMRKQLQRLEQHDPSQSVKQRSQDRDIWNFWISNARPESNRVVLSKDYITGETSKETVLYVREPYLALWSAFCRTHTAISYPQFCDKRPAHVKSCPNNPRCRCRWHMQIALILPAYIRLVGLRRFQLTRLSDHLPLILCRDPSYNCFFGH